MNLFIRAVDFRLFTSRNHHWKQKYSGACRTSYRTIGSISADTQSSASDGFYFVHTYFWSEAQSDAVVDQVKSALSVNVQFVCVVNGLKYTKIKSLSYSFCYLCALYTLIELDVKPVIVKCKQLCMCVWQQAVDLAGTNYSIRIWKSSNSS